VQNWVIGTILLGAGAEHLEAEIKRKLTSALIKTAALIIHHWTAVHHAVDFEEIKANLTTDKVVSEIVDVDAENADFEEARRQVRGIIELLEFAFVSEPCRRILQHLCEAARHRVLATSVEKASVAGLMDSIVRAAWLIDIDFRCGRSEVLAAIKDLPNSVFLRTVLATHFLERVYWSHWSQDHRLALLDAAEQTIKPIASINKGELKRLVERSNKKGASLDRSNGEPTDLK
jgi:hypothetical protein